jgi:hypothetical protein
VTLTTLQKEGVLTGQFKRLEELPTSFKLLDALPWNNRVGNPAGDVEGKIRDYKMRKLSQQNSQKNFEKLEKSNNYVSPIEYVDRMQEEIRKQKKEGTFSLTRRVNRNVLEDVEEPIDTRNRLSIEQSRIVRTSQHSGVWTASPTDGRYFWTDTGSFEFYSPGDIVRTRNLDKKNYGALTLSATSLNAPRRITLLEKARTSQTLTR